MSDMSENLKRVGQRNLTALLRGLSDVSQKRASELLGISETSMSEFKRDHMERFCALAAVCGLKLVPTTSQSFDDEHISALRTLAKIGLKASETMSEGGHE